jgi:hypothetical protein
MDCTPYTKIVIARGYAPHGEEEGIDYVPDHTCSIVLWMGAFVPGQVGAHVSAEQALTNYRNAFVRLKGEWFLPILERLANGETISIDEILRYGESATGQTPKVTFGPVGEK